MIDNLNYKHSIDMIRLKSYVQVDRFQSFYASYIDEPKIETWLGNSCKDYRYNFRISTKSGGFWLGYLHNSETIKLDTHNLVIEFNPNKVDLSDPILLDILTNFFGGDYEIISFDWALDLDVDINNIFYFRNGKHSVKIFDYGGSNKTIYIGQGSGRVKIYNKAIEQCIKDKIWTRVEYSFTINALKSRLNGLNFNFDIPQIYILSQIPLIENKTDRALFYAVIHGYNIDDLTRDKKNKIKALFEGINPLSIDFKCLKSDLVSLIDSLNSLILV